jgi:hypothetical protein
MGRGRRSRWGTTLVGEMRKSGRWRTDWYGRTSHWPAFTMSKNSAHINSMCSLVPLCGPRLAAASRWALVHWADDKLAGAPVDRRVRMGAAECGSNVVSERQDSPRWRVHKASKDMPDLINKADDNADDNADLPKSSGRIRYGLATGGDADGIAETATVPLAVAARRPSAGPGL